MAAVTNSDIRSVQTEIHVKKRPLYPLDITKKVCVGHWSRIYEQWQNQVSYISKVLNLDTKTDRFPGLSLPLKTKSALLSTTNLSLFWLAPLRPTPSFSPRRKRLRIHSFMKLAYFCPSMMSFIQHQIFCNLLRVLGTQRFWYHESSYTVQTGWAAITIYIL